MKRILLAAGFLAAASIPSTALAAPKDTTCRPRNIIVWTVKPRVHVQCEAAKGNIRYFAFPMTGNLIDEAARILDTLIAARALGRTLIINYDPSDTSGASWGCNSGDCRPIRAIGF